MAPRKCSLKSCASVGLRCFGLPSDAVIRKLWLEWIIADEGVLPSKKNILLCENHFKDSDKGLRKLNKGAVPFSLHQMNELTSHQCSCNNKIVDDNSMSDHNDTFPVDVTSRECDDVEISDSACIPDDLTEASVLFMNEGTSHQPCNDIVDYNLICDHNEPISHVISMECDNVKISDMASISDNVTEENVSFTAVIDANLYDGSCTIAMPVSNCGFDQCFSDYTSVVEVNVLESTIQTSKPSCEDDAALYFDGIGGPINDLELEKVSENLKLPRIQRRCCVSGCDNNNTSHSMFAFPRVMKLVDRELVTDEVWLLRCKKWIQFCGNANLQSTDVSAMYKRHHVCDAHFNRDDFISNARKRLSQSSVPSLHGPGRILGEWLGDNTVLNCNEPVYVDKNNNGQCVLSGHVNDEIRLYDKIQEMQSLRSRKFSRKFEDLLKSFTMQFCPVCKEKFMHYPGMKRAHRGKNLCWKFSSSNRMDPGEVPDVLKDLSYLEEQLIARVHPVLMVRKLKGCQYGYKGNVINFCQDVKNFAKQLPHRIDDMNSIITVRFKNHKGQMSDFQVRAKKVHNALLWLKANNEHYGDIEISEENLEMLPEDGNVQDLIPVMSLNGEGCQDSGNSDDLEEDIDTDAEGENDCNEKVIVSGVPCANFVKQNDQISAALDWPEESAEPISESTPGFIVSAFPTLFPFGNCDLREEREKEIKMHDYFKHMLCYGDERFAKHPTFRFFAFNMWMRHTALTNGNVFVNKDSELSQMNVAQLKDHIKEKPGVMKQLMFMGSNIRGSKAYWKSRCGELRDMVEQIGLPTIFLTMSAADLYWPDLYRLLTGKDIAEVSMRERRTLLQENPLIVDMFFQYRLECYVEHVLQPKYEVTDYWYRIEYQHRGSPHVHGLFWLKGAPDVSNLVGQSEVEKKKVLKYFDDLVCAVNPHEDCPMPKKHPCETLFEGVDDVEMDLAQLLKKVQRHTKCSPDYCIRVNRRTKQKSCRFKFPIDIEPSSRLQVNEESGEVEFIPERNDPRLNKFNPFVIATWRANIDIAPVLSKKAIIEYISKYVAKSEIGSQTLSEICTNVCEALNSNDKAKRAIQKILIKNCVERDISAQEVCHILLGSKLFCSGGRNFVVVYTNRSKWSPVNIIEDEGEGEGNASRVKSFMEKYAERPVHLDTLSMWDIAKHYNVRRWSKMKKPNIVRVFPRLSLRGNEEKDEEYFRQKVMLYVPWTKETEDLLKSENETWRDVYDKHGVAHFKVSEVDINITGRFDQGDDHEDIDVSHNDVSNEDWMIAARLCGSRSSESVELGMREIDLAHDWSAYSKHYECYGDMKYLQRFIESEKKNDNDSYQATELPNVTFSKEQEQVKNIMEKQIQSLESGDFANIPKRVLVQGKAGTGKSLLIKFLVDNLLKKFGPGSFLLMGPTGVSAINIGGHTAHSVLKIPTNGKYFRKLNGETAKTFSSMMENVKFIILDEYSMVGCTLLGMIDQRIREGTGVNEPFGNLNVYFFGDYKQLPPVKDVSMFGGVCKSDLAKHGRSMFNLFESYCVLTKGHRQNDPVFQDLLDRLSTGDSTNEDYNLLKSRFNTKVTRCEENSFNDAIRLFSTKDAVHQYNDFKLLHLKDDNENLVPIARIPGHHHGKRASTASSDKASGLQSVLYLSRGVRIMLRTNLWVKKGLVNGTMGTVVDILYENDQEPPNDAPSVIMCKFDYFNGPGIGPENLVPIIPVVRAFAQGSDQCSRQQFPIVLCYACSIHKSQGLTLKKAVIDIGESEFALGLCYVGLSRVRSLDGLLLKPFTRGRLSIMKNRNEMSLREKFAKKFVGE